jgi:hypothetical protein
MDTDSRGYLAQAVYAPVPIAVRPEIRGSRVVLADGFEAEPAGDLDPRLSQVGAAAILVETRRPASRGNRLAASSAAPDSPDKAGCVVVSGRLPGLGLLRQAEDW